MISSAYLDALQIHATSSYSLRKGSSGFGTPAPRRESSERPRRHGERDRTRYYSGRVFNLRGYAKGTTPALAWAAFDTLKGAIELGDTAHVLKFTRLGLAYAERALVRVASEVKEDEIGAPSKRIGWTAQLVAEDPRLYADALTNASYSPSTAGIGLVFPVTFPLAFLGAAGSTMTATNAGNAPTPPVWTITGPATTPGIRNETTGEEILTTAQLLAGETLTIDVDARTVKLLGSTLRPDLIDAAASSWFELGAGASIIRLTGSGFVSGQTQLAVSFRDARL